MIHALLFWQKLNGLLQYVRYMLAKFLNCYQLWNEFIYYTWDLSILSLMLKKLVDSFPFGHHDVTEFMMIIHNCKTIFEQYHVNSSVEFEETNK